MSSGKALSPWGQTLGAHSEGRIGPAGRIWGPSAARLECEAPTEVRTGPSEPSAERTGRRSAGWVPGRELSSLAFSRVPGSRTLRSESDWEPL